MASGTNRMGVSSFSIYVLRKHFDDYSLDAVRYCNDGNDFPRSSWCWWSVSRSPI